MGCSPSVLLDHIQKETTTQQVPLKKSTIKRSPKKEANLGVARRKSSLPVTPEEDQLDFYKTSHDDKIGVLLPPSKGPLKVLLVFNSIDPVVEAVQSAAEKLSYDTTICTSDDNALEAFQSTHHDLIIVDTRASKELDYDTLCRSIRNTKGSNHAVVVAIIKRSAIERDESTIKTLLVDSGFNRCLLETSSVNVWINELMQLKLTDCRNAALNATSQSLYAALDRCRDGVFVTDETCRLQYMNNAAEKYFGYRAEETYGRTIQEQLISEALQVNAMMAVLSRGRSWQGPLTFRRKTHEPTTLSCRSVPINAAGRSPTHFVIVMDIPTEQSSQTSIVGQSRGSVHSITRKGSTDMRSIGSDYLRRTSLAKLSTLPLEAPITRVIALVGQAQEMASSNSQLVLILDRVVDTLRCTELYSPNVKEDSRGRTDEPVASDLIGALLSQHPISQLYPNSRRSSNDSSVIRITKSGTKLKHHSSHVRDLLETSLTWEFDIFRLEELTNKRPLAHLGMNLFSLFDVPSVLQCDEKVMYNWLTVIEANYHAENQYHNSTHAADVMQAIAGFLDTDRLKAFMEPMDEVTALIAACAHDVDHPGKSSAFLSNSDNQLALLYNDITVLESHHAALTFKLTLGNDKVNIFKNLDRETYKIARQNVIDMILATEMTKHFEHLTKFVNVFCTKPTINSDIEIESDYLTLSGNDKRENITLIKRIMIKCADVSNPTRPLAICVEWARRIAEEYFQQTDEEMKRDLPVVMPMFDRRTCSIPKAQIGFVDFIIKDMIDAWNAFIDMPQLLQYMKENYMKWKEFDEQGHATVADIEKIQQTVLASGSHHSSSSSKFKRNSKSN